MHSYWRTRSAVAAAIVLSIMTAAVAAVMITPAGAQETVRRSWSIFDIFRPAPRRYYEMPQERQRPARRTKTRKTKAKPSIQEPKVEAVEKMPDARTIVVVGDFLASGLAEGLEVQFAQDPNIRILDRSKGSSGFVRRDYFDWTVEIANIVNTDKPAAVIVMMGSNDRQQMKVDGTSEIVRSDKWVKEYETRVDAFAEAIEATKVPFFWMGMPAFKTTKMTSDMLAFNDLYQNAAEAGKGEFIDIWDGFVDQNGAYVQTGPDVSGQPVKLRAGDGINMTKQGKAKLAFYADKPLRKLFGLGLPGTTPPATGNLPAAGPIGPAPLPDRTPPMSLNDPELDGGLELMGADAPATPTNAGKGADKRAVPSVMPAPEPGRADDFSWLRRQQQLVPAIEVETTTAIRR